jgi:hypothetical protein
MLPCEFTHHAPGAATPLLPLTAMQKLRIRFGTGRQRMVLERWTNPKPQRRTRSPRYGVPSCRGKPAGVAKRPRERPPTRNPYRHDSQLCRRCPAQRNPLQLHALLPALARHVGVLATEAKERAAQHAWAMETEMVSTLVEVYVCEASAAADPGRSLLQVRLPIRRPHQCVRVKEYEETTEPETFYQRRCVHVGVDSSTCAGGERGGFVSHTGRVVP